MAKARAATAAALSILLLASCAGQETAEASNDSVAADPATPGNTLPIDGPAPAAPADPAAAPAPPPDAVSHPDGYLPPAPDEASAPATNESAPRESPPATEDQYIRNGQ